LPSRLSRARGSKLQQLGYLQAVLESRLSRARGSKLVRAERDNVVANVAPFTGAWIETFSQPFEKVLSLVAPFTGAWIETRTISCFASTIGSRLSRARGSKRR